MTINLWNKQQMHLNPASLFGRQLHVALPEGFTSYTPIIGAMGPYLWLVFVPTLLWNFYIKPGRFMNTACSSVLVVPPVIVLPPRLHSMLELSKQKGVVYRKHPNHKWFATWVGVTGIMKFQTTPLKINMDTQHYHASKVLPFPKHHVWVSMLDFLRQKSWSSHPKSQTFKRLNLETSREREKINKSHLGKTRKNHRLFKVPWGKGYCDRSQEGCYNHVHQVYFLPTSIKSSPKPL